MKSPKSICLVGERPILLCSRSRRLSPAPPRPPRPVPCRPDPYKLLPFRFPVALAGPLSFPVGFPSAQAVLVCGNPAPAPWPWRPCRCSRCSRCSRTATRRCRRRLPSGGRPAARLASASASRSRFVILSRSSLHLLMALKFVATPSFKILVLKQLALALADDLGSIFGQFIAPNS